MGDYSGTLILLFIFLAIVVFGVVVGIYQKVKDEIIEPKKEEKRNSNIADFKFSVFINSVNMLFPNAKRLNYSENLFVFNDKISNGIEEIGEFYYLIEDKIETKENSVGLVKLHNYTIKVECKIKPNEQFLKIGPCSSNLSLEYCNSVLTNLKNEILNTERYLHAVEVNKIN